MWWGCRLVSALLLLASQARALDFATREEIPLGAAGRAVVRGELNGDGIPDYVAATDQGLAVLLGAREAKFASPTLFRLPAAPQAIVAADFDGDHHTDIAFASFTELGAYVRYGNGDGSFSDEIRLAPTERVLFLHAADLDADGRADLLLGHAEGVAVFYAIGRKQFREPVFADTQGVEGRWFTTAPLDASGRPYLVLLEGGGEAAGVFELQEDGKFRPRQASPVGLDPRTGAVADLDGDKTADLVVADAAGISWLKGDGKLSFTDPVRLLHSTDISALGTADLNADGALDILATDRRRGVLVVLLNSGSGKFDRRFSYVVGPAPENLLAADVTGDGVADVLVASKMASGLTLCRGRGDGTFRGLPAFDLGPDPSVAVAYDANHDGHLDVAIAHRDAGLVTLSLGDGHGNFRLQNSMAVGTDPRALAVGDFDNDGALDLVTANFGSDDVAVLAGTTRGELTAPLLIATGLGPSALAVADFDRDGHSDIAVANGLSNSVSVIFGDGAGRFPRTRNFPVIAKPDFVLAGDLGATGNVDLLVGSSRSERVSILRGGPAGLKAPQEDNLGNRVRPVISADFDGDEILDVVRLEESEDKVGILRGLPGGGLAPPEKFVVGRQPSAAVAADFDEDGRTDLLLLHRRSRTVAFLRNTTSRQPAGSATAPTPAPTPPPAPDPWRQAIGTW
ncbi:MAG: hypothetical protein KatS3mg077_0776 [Candidatus Binatia bacterium]|nr:MAG: hypothetical protein KatS3mg077_0776 [Candidatus Binatia bacterium]